MDIKSIALPLVAAISVIAFLLIARGFAFKFFQVWARKTETLIDDDMLGAIKTPSIYWAIVIGLYAGLSTADVPERHLHYIAKAIQALVIFSVTITAANLSERVFSRYVNKIGFPIPSTGIASAVIKGVIVLIGLLVMLSALGVSIAPLITALGVGGLAIALALQDTLANLFAGIHILIDKSIRPGDFIRIEAGHEGRVVDITWRTTRIRTLPNNIVVIPNSQIARTVVVNYSMPDMGMALPMQVSVDYREDPERVERVLLEVAGLAAKEVQGIVADKEPLVLLHPGFGESSMDFTVVVHIREFVDQYMVQHELRKRIFKRFRLEGIDIPYPHRAVYIKGNASEKG
jgi:small-conductance mechanosensitive channel